MTQVIEKIGGEYENRTRVHGFAIRLSHCVQKYGDKFGDKSKLPVDTKNQKSHQAIELSGFLWLRR
ncbi:hypothetical protein, partial [Parasedimentitalea psychrophila]|uniref:Uncharacterized protein n=1 Tax=Parasedimentitalea psychrophila TaxID=2997337 RepID=A0A9Y2P6C3_9RHOB